MVRIRQHGQVLLGWLIGLVLLASSLLWLTPPSSRSITTDRALDQAIEALLGYASSYPETHLKGAPARLALVPGHLPCPNLENTSNPGQEATQCGSQGISALGRLPWTTLGLPPLKDSSGECLWYAVSGHYKNNPKADLLNPDSPGQFIVELQTPTGRMVLADDVVAVVIAPGPPLPGQQRPYRSDTLCTSALSPSDHLDGDPTGLRNFSVSSDPEGITHLLIELPVQKINDRIRWISRAALWKTLGQRTDLQEDRALFRPSVVETSTEPALLQRLGRCLQGFAQQSSGHLPWAAPMTLSAAPPNTFSTDALNDQKNLRSGRLPLHIWDSVRDIRNTLGGNLSGLNHAIFTACTTSDSTGCRLFRTDFCPSLLPVAGYPTPLDDPSRRDSPDGWLDKWKDHLFYAVAPGFTPNQASPGCTPATCLHVNGRPYAAILLFSGNPLAGQNRLTLANKQFIQNYLEAPNADSLNSQGSEFASTGNDRLVCLRPDLSLSPACAD